MIRADEALRAMSTFPIRTLEEILAPGPCLVLAPHPDDESLGCGGLIALAAGEGRRVEVVVLTDGTGSHPESKAYPRPRLAALREAEAAKAATQLGLHPSALRFIRLPDQHAPHQGLELAQVSDCVRALLRESGAATLLTTWQCDPHPDHVAASLIGRNLVRGAPVRLLEFPIWGWTLPHDRLLRAQPPRGARLDVRAALDRKRAAIAAHASQTTDLIDGDPNGPCLPDSFLARFTGPYETFLFASA